MADVTTHARAGERAPTARIETLDLVRGVALLGIFVMNAVAFSLPEAAYSNLDAGGNGNPADTAIGVSVGSSSTRR